MDSNHHPLVYQTSIPPFELRVHCILIVCIRGGIRTPSVLVSKASADANFATRTDMNIKVDPVGFEPTTLCLKDRYSAAEF